MKEWINQLTQRSVSVPNLRPDLDTLVAQIIAWRKFQAGIIKRVDESTNCGKDLTGERNNYIRDVEKSFTAARHCTQCLEEIFTNNSNSNGMQNVRVYVPMFNHSLAAWGDASRLALLLMGNSASLDPYHGVHEILNIVRLFDVSAVQKGMFTAGSKVNVDSNESIDTYESSFQKDHEQPILQCMGGVYAEALSHLHQIDAAPTAINGENINVSHASIFLERISDVEKMLRLYEFNYRRCFSNGYVTPNDMIASHQLYREVLRGCMWVKSPTDYGHVMRICKIIMDYLSWRSKQFSDVDSVGRSEDITDLFVDITSLAGKVVLSPHERMLVLTRIHNEASKFFGQQHALETKSYATVDKTRLMGAMRVVMGDSEMAESFLSSFDTHERTMKKRRAKSRRRTITSSE